VVVGGTPAPDHVRDEGDPRRAAFLERTK
jgi:hypothetical protein